VNFIFVIPLASRLFSGYYFSHPPLLFEAGQVAASPSGSSASASRSPYPNIQTR